VTLTRAHTIFVKRTARPAQGAVVNLFIGNSCGAGGAFRHFVTDLGDPTGAWAPRNDDNYQVHEKTNFPYVVKNDDPETFVLTATTVNCDCTWRIQLDWTSDTETGHTIIDNAVGRNFRTMGTDDTRRSNGGTTTLRTRGSRSGPPRRHGKDRVNRSILLPSPAPHRDSQRPTPCARSRFRSCRRSCVTERSRLRGRREDTADVPARWTGMSMTLLSVVVSSTPFAVCVVKPLVRQ
jgi:hypothetical protein